jgi:hypothetical protein
MSLRGVKARLTPHPATPCAALRRLEVEARWSPERLALAFRGEGEIDGLAIPAPAAPRRTDGLWRRTCFEAFALGAGGAYVELNLSPSGEWAAYRFSGYRDGMAPLEPFAAPAVAFERAADRLQLDAGLVARAFAAPSRLAISAVIEETGGRLSYWALAHPPGRPDFHHASGFVLELPEPA